MVKLQGRTKTGVRRSITISKAASWLKNEGLHSTTFAEACMLLNLPFLMTFPSCGKALASNSTLFAFLETACFVWAVVLQLSFKLGSVANLGKLYQAGRRKWGALCGWYLPSCWSFLQRTRFSSRHASQLCLLCMSQPHEVVRRRCWVVQHAWWF